MLKIVRSFENYSIFSLSNKFHTVEWMSAAKQRFRLTKSTQNWTPTIQIEQKTYVICGGRTDVRIRRRFNGPVSHVVVWSNWSFSSFPLATPMLEHVLPYRCFPFDWTQARARQKFHFYSPNYSVLFIFSIHTTMHCLRHCWPDSVTIDCIRSCNLPNIHCSFSFCVNPLISLIRMCMHICAWQPISNS